jgi:hypothetical protein
LVNMANKDDISRPDPRSVAAQIEFDEEIQFAQGRITPLCQIESPTIEQEEALLTAVLVEAQKQKVCCHCCARLQLRAMRLALHGECTITARMVS